jgi:hypothetical protein
MKDELQACYAAGWRNPEDLGVDLSPHDSDPDFMAEHTALHARSQTRIGDIGSYVAGIGVVVDAERVSSEACKCSPGNMNWLFLPIKHSAKLTRAEIS